MNNIVDPLTNKVHSIFSNHGTFLLKKYVTLLQNGGGKKQKRKGKDTIKSKKTKTRATKTRNKKRNIDIKKQDLKYKKKMDMLNNLLRPVRNAIDNAENFEANFIEPMMEAASMTSDEINNYLITKDETDKVLKYLKFRDELKNSGGWVGQFTPINMIKTALKQDKPMFTRILLFITAIILAVETVRTNIRYLPASIINMDDTNMELNEITTYDNKQWEFYDGEQWEETLKGFEDETLRNNIEYLSGRPDLLYDSRNIECYKSVARISRKFKCRNSIVSRDTRRRYRKRYRRRRYSKKRYRRRRYSRKRYRRRRYSRKRYRRRRYSRRRYRRRRYHRRSNTTVNRLFFTCC